MARILIIEDERLLCELLRSALLLMRHDVKAAFTGKQAIATFEEWRPHLTLVDLGLPDMSGLDVIRGIQSMEPWAKILVLTGEGSKGEEAAALGVTDYFCKGISMEILSSSVARMLEGQRPDKPPQSLDNLQRTVPPAIAVSATRSPVRISVVLIEDDVLNRTLIEQYLTEQNYDVRVACDGIAGLELIGQNPPDYVVLDMQLPGLSGLDVMDQLRKKQYGGKIVAVTGTQHVGVLKAVHAMGASDILCKPVNLKRLRVSLQL